MIRSSLSRRVALMLLLALIAAPAGWSQAPVQTERRATIAIRVDPAAKLTVEGKATTQKGERRTFNSPTLEPGKKYTYTFVAEWMPRNNYETYRVTRKVTVEAGKKTPEIDMSKPDFDKGDTLIIIWVATPPKVIKAMMKLANVGKDDVVYDLGCGRGEIVIAAVKDFKAKRGVGIDIEERRVQESKENAKKAGVADKVEFRHGDVLKVKDLAEATVVTLYMSDELNKLLLPILQKQLKPGARIVSHRFTMGDWKPDKTETVDVEHDIPEEKLIHLWTIPKK
ncbi:MAG: TIGR03000 domain-containing protein [Gemmataceae bacterium]